MPTQEATQQQVIIVDSSGKPIDWTEPITVSMAETSAASEDFDQQILADNLAAINTTLLLVAVLLALLLGSSLVRFFYSAFRGR